MATVVEGDQKAPFSIATTPRCRGACYSFSWISPLSFDPYLKILSVKQGGIKYHVLNLWYDSTWEWTLVSRTIGEHSTPWANRLDYIYHHHHHIVLAARISLTLSRHSSLSFIALGRSSGQQPVSSHSCWMYVRAGRPAFARPCVGIHKSTSLMSSSLLLQQCPACLVRLTWIVFVIGGRWPYSWCLVGCCCQDLFRIARSKLYIYIYIYVYKQHYNGMLKKYFCYAWVLVPKLYPMWSQILVMFWLHNCNIMAEGFRFIYLAFGFS